MDFSRQARYFAGSGIRGIVAAAVFASSAACLAMRAGYTRLLLTWFALIVAAVAVSIYFSPDYLHLSVHPEKRASWQVKVRWRILAGLLIMALWIPASAQSRMAAVAAVAALLLLNLNARLLVRFPDVAAFYFWFTDLGMLTIAFFMGIDRLLAAALAAASLHLALLTSSRHYYLRGFFLTIAAFAVVGAGFFVGPLDGRGMEPVGIFLLVTAAATAWLARRSAGHNRENISAALDELVEYTGLPQAEIRRLWSVADQELAANWKAAAIGEDDRERLAEWYRQNSCLYMFAISAYTLEYKKIVANLKMLRYGRGACLDFGAGTGELILELARRGHGATYYDVEGETMKFARWRAQRLKLQVQIAAGKDELARMAQQHPFETLFAFDVLEHVPHLEEELDFLTSLLAPGGRMVFDVPAGSTKSHPMHLNHNLEVSAFMASRGMLEKRSFLQRTLWQQGKYVLQKPV